MKTKNTNLKEKETENFIAVLKKYKVKVTQSNETSKKFLIDLGVLTETGKRTKNYEHLCIPEGQG